VSAIRVGIPHVTKFNVGGALPRQTVKWGTPTLIPNTEEYSLRYSLVQMRSSSLMLMASEKDILNGIKMILSSLRYCPLKS